MSDIFPAQDQDLGEVIAELARAGFVQDRDYWIQHTYDLRPYLSASDDAFAEWQSLHGADDSDQATKKAESEKDEKAEPEKSEKSEAGSPAGRQSSKRR
jgi:hypothetical protein